MNIQAGDIHPNPMQHFTKLNHFYYLTRSIRSRDLPNTIRFLFFELMDANNRIEFDKPVHRVIHELTGMQKDSIRKRLAAMQKDGEIIRLKNDDRVVIFNPWVANRQGMLLDGIPYDGNDPRYNEDDDRIIQAIRSLKKSTTKYAEGKAMNVSQEVMQLRQKCKALEEENLILKGKNLGHMEMTGTSIAASIRASVDKIQQMRERYEDEAPIQEPTKLHAVKTDKKKSYEIRH